MPKNYLTLRLSSETTDLEIGIDVDIDLWLFSIDVWSYYNEQTWVIIEDILSIDVAEICF